MNALLLSPSIFRQGIKFNSLPFGGSHRESMQGIPIKIDI
jgi:hypothetical protein